MIVFATDKPTSTAPATETENVAPVAPPLDTLTPAESSPTTTPNNNAAKPGPTETPTQEIIIESICNYTVVHNIVVRAGPAPAFKVIGYLSANTLVTALGRNQDLSWILVQLTASGRQGWITTTYVQIADPTCRLPLTISNVTPQSNNVKEGEDSAGGGDYP